MKEGKDFNMSGSASSDQDAGLTRFVCMDRPIGTGLGRWLVVHAASDMGGFNVIQCQRPVGTDIPF